MSLGKLTGKIKEGAQDIKSATGWQRILVQMGIGVAIGAIVDIILNYIIVVLIYQRWKPESECRIYGLQLFPYDFDTATNQGYCHYDDVLLIVITIAMLFTKKIWLTLGFFVGWFSSSYLGLYTALGMQKFEPVVTP